MNRWQVVKSSWIYSSISTGNEEIARNLDTATAERIVNFVNLLVESNAAMAAACSLALQSGIEGDAKWYLKVALEKAAKL